MKDIKTKPTQKRAVLPRVRRIAKAAAIGIIKTAKDKAVQTADTAVSVQGQENQSASTQASGQMISGGAHIAAGTAQKTVQATAFVYRFAKKHKNIKTVQSLADVAPLEDATPPAAADTPVQPQTDIKTRPLPEAFSKTHIPAEQPPSPKVRFTDNGASQTRPVSAPQETPAVHIAQGRAADKAPTVPTDIKQRAAPSVKAAAKSIKTKENVAQTTAAPTQKSTPIQPNIPGGQINAASAVAPTTEIVPTTAPMQQCARQIVKTKKCDTQPVSLSIKPTPSFEPQTAVAKDKPQPAFRPPQEIVKTKRDLPARFAADKPALPQAGIKSASVNADTGTGKSTKMCSIKTRGQSVTKTMRHTVKADVRGIKTAKQTAAKSKQAAKAAQKTAQQTARVVKAAAQKAAQAAKVVTKAIVSAIKAFLAALKSLVAAIAAIGGTAFAIILIIALVAVIAGSVLGIFMSVEPSGHGTPVNEVTTLLNEEYYKKISEIQAQVKHDKVEIKASDGVMGVKWEDVLAIYSCKLAASDDPMEVVTFDEQKKEVLRGILWDMNAIDYTTRVETKYIDVPVLDEDGNQIYNENGEPLMDEESYTETTLVITVAHKTTDEMAVAYNFTPKQYEALALLKESDYASLWAKLLGGLVNGSGEIITPDTDWTGTDIFSWPLPQSFRISSPYGYRKDPFTGKISFHGGTDIAAPFGTPILAAAGGTVTVANATDPWGMSYGYHIKINHGGGQETLYAHASSICVTAGQDVQAGEVIGYVGSTGNSNGNHLHFEVRINGKTTDALAYFQQ